MVKWFLLKVTTRGLRSSVRNLAYELRVCIKHFSGRAKTRKFKDCQGLKLHLACGPKVKPGWLNIDLRKEADLALDLREGLPFSDNSCSIVYSEHFLEHIDYPEPARSLLKDCYRVLESGGVFSVGVPDTEWIISEYVGLRNEGFFELAKQRWHAEWCITKMEHLNHHFRQGNEHRFVYDFKTLRRALEAVGFVEVRQRVFDTQLDSEDRRVGTLYVEAIRPEQHRAPLKHSTGLRDSSNRHTGCPAITKEPVESA